jgi:hypothetical protein
VSLQPSKYKVFTKQVYNHLIDEYGDHDMNVGIIMNHINNDELLKLLLKNVRRIEKVEIAFMVYFFSKTNDIESSFSKVRGNLINIGMYHYRDLGTRDETCHECDGSGTEYCSNCDGSGDVNCDRCDGNGTEECRNCDGSGEVDGEACSDCQGNGDVECSYCDGEGKFTCERCDGYGSVDCDYCDGTGEYESSDEYYTEDEIDFFGLNPELKSLPEDTFLDDDQVNMIYHSEPILLEINEIDDKVPSWEPGQKYSGDSEGDPLNVINNIYEID